MKYTKSLQAEILARIDFSEYENRNPITDADKINMLVNCAFDEVGHNFGRVDPNTKQKYTRQGVLAYWLSGLPSCFDIPFQYGEILAFAVKIGSIPADYTDKQADRVCENYWNFMAANILQLQAKLNK